jgi:hypothetical protein
MGLMEYVSTGHHPGALKIVVVSSHIHKSFTPSQRDTYRKTENGLILEKRRKGRLEGRREQRREREREREEDKEEKKRV